jgi:hypothetical protein
LRKKIAHVISEEIHHTAMQMQRRSDFLSYKVAIPFKRISSEGIQRSSIILSGERVMLVYSMVL